MELLIVTGMSGAGKSQAANALEDIGFYCVDNISRSGNNTLVCGAFVAQRRSAEENGYSDRYARRRAFFRRLTGFSATLKRTIFSIKYCFWTRLTMCLYAAIRKTAARSTRWRTATICR